MEGLGFFTLNLVLRSFQYCFRVYMRCISDYPSSAGGSQPHENPPYSPFFKGGNRVPRFNGENKVPPFRKGGMQYFQLNVPRGTLGVQFVVTCWIMIR